MHVDKTFRKPRSSPPSVSMTSASPGASELSCGGFVPRVVGWGAVMAVTPALVQAASTSPDASCRALATLTG